MSLVDHAVSKRLARDQVAVEEPPDRQWRAWMQLDFYRANGKTSLHRDHYGPLRIQRPFYPENKHPDICHVYLLHPPGGIVSGDSLQINLNVQAQARAVVTTPGAAKYYRSAGGGATVTNELTVGDGALLEWLPHENIFYNNTRQGIDTRISLLGSSGFIGWEVHCLGRGEPCVDGFEGNLSLSLLLELDGQPLLVERMIEDPEQNLSLIKRQTGLRGATVVGTMLCKIPGTTTSSVELEELIEMLRREVNHAQLALTGFDNLLIARYLGNRSSEAKSLFLQLRKVIRESVFSLEPYEPRIWLT